MGWSSDGKEGGSDGKEGSKDGGRDGGFVSDHELIFLETSNDDVFTF